MRNASLTLMISGEGKLGVGVGRQITFVRELDSKQTIKIGRDGRSDICLADTPGIARMNACIEIGSDASDAFTLFDLGPANVKVNGRIISSCKLKEHDVIDIGSVKIEVEKIVVDVDLSLAFAADEPVVDVLRRAADATQKRAEEEAERARRERLDARAKEVTESQKRVADAILLWADTPLPTTTANNLKLISDFASCRKDDDEAFSLFRDAVQDVLRQLGSPEAVASYLSNPSPHDQPLPDCESGAIRASAHPKTAPVLEQLRKAEQEQARKAWLNMPESDWFHETRNGRRVRAPNGSFIPLRLRFLVDDDALGGAAAAEAFGVLDEYRRRQTIAAELDAKDAEARKALDARKPALYAKIFDALADTTTMQGVKEGKIGGSGAIELLWGAIFGNLSPDLLPSGGWYQPARPLSAVERLSTAAFRRREELKKLVLTRTERLAKLGTFSVSYQEGSSKHPGGGDRLLTCTVVLDDTLKVEAQAVLEGRDREPLSLEGIRF